MREIAISMYLFGFQLLYALFSLFPLKNKITFIVSFAENASYIYDQIQQEQINIRSVFLCHPNCYAIFKQKKEATYLFETKNIGHTIKGVYHLATSNNIIVDNYYGFLSAIHFKEAVCCIQIWHAAGAIKQFGLKDPSNKARHPQALLRFRKVYEKFHYTVVGSDKMAAIYEKAFQTTSFLTTGVPRTDFFFQEDRMQIVRKSLYEMNPTLKDKKIILYAPTFRKDSEVVTNIALDIPKLHDVLKNEYILMLRLHPKVSCQIDFNEDYKDFVFDYSGYPLVNDLLVITDILISDYSSIPMEFSLLGRKMIFYAYDLEDYQESNGFWEDYEHAMPGPVVRTTNEVIESILDKELDSKKIANFSTKWNRYSVGNSSKSLVDRLFKPIENN